MAPQYQLSNSIRQYTKLHNITQKKLAEQLNVSPLSISAWVNNRKFPANKYLPLLNKTFHLNLKPTNNQNRPKPFTGKRIVKHHIAQNIKQVAKKRNLTLSELMKQLKLKEGMIYNLETNKALQDLKRLCPVLNCSVDQLLGLTDVDRFSDNILKNCYTLGHQSNQSIAKIEIKAKLKYGTLRKLDQQAPIQNFRKICRYLHTSADSILKAPQADEKQTVKQALDQIDANTHPLFKTLTEQIQHQGLTIEQFSAQLNTNYQTMIQALTNDKAIQLIKDLMNGFHVTFKELTATHALIHRPYLQQTNAQTPKLSIDEKRDHDQLQNPFAQRLLEFGKYVPLNDDTIKTVTHYDDPQTVLAIMNSQPFIILYTTIAEVASDQADQLLIPDQTRWQLKPRHANLNQVKMKSEPAPKNAPDSIKETTQTTVDQPSKTIVTTMDSRLNRLFNQIKHLDANQILILNDLIQSWQKSHD